LAWGLRMAGSFLPDRWGFQLLRPLGASALSSAVMGALVWWAPQLAWIPAAILLYGLFLWLLGGIKSEDWASVRSFLGRRFAGGKRL
jgi:hypothetical protein